jgi:hypothetical protein
MSLFAKVRNGTLTREGFVKSLEGYQTDRDILNRNVQRFGPEMFQNKLNEIQLSISICELFIENFDKIAKGSKQRHRLVK